MWVKQKRTTIYAGDGDAFQISLGKPFMLFKSWLEFGVTSNLISYSFTYERKALLYYLKIICKIQ